MTGRPDSRSRGPSVVAAFLATLVGLAAATAIADARCGVDTAPPWLLLGNTCGDPLVLGTALGINGSLLVVGVAIPWIGGVVVASALRTRGIALVVVAAQVVHVVATIVFVLQGERPDLAPGSAP